MINKFVNTCVDFIFDKIIKVDEIEELKSNNTIIQDTNQNKIKKEEKNNALLQKTTMKNYSSQNKPFINSSLSIIQDDESQYIDISSSDSTHINNNNNLSKKNNSEVIDSSNIISIDSDHRDIKREIPRQKSPNWGFRSTVKRSSELLKITKNKKANYISTAEKINDLGDQLKETDVSIDHHVIENLTPQVDDKNSISPVITFTSTKKEIKPIQDISIISSLRRFTFQIHE